MIIKILGTGCKKCDKLEENTKVALEELGKDAEVVKVGDLKGNCVLWGDDLANISH